MTRYVLAVAVCFAGVALVSCSGAKSSQQSCGTGTVACGNGCIPSTAVCCDTSSASSSSYCTNAAGSGCFANSSQQCGSASFCCSQDGTFGSNDCPAGQHHCGLLCQAGACPSTGGLGDAGGGGGVDAGIDGGPTDPCNAAGTWTLSCPTDTGCGGHPASAYTADAVITADVAASGGTFSDGTRDYTFTPSTCTLGFVLAGTPCGDEPGTFTLYPDGGGVGQSTFYREDNGSCTCTFDRPAGSCSVTRD